MRDPKAEKSQLEKFRDAARELGTDDDPERVRKLAKAKPLPADKPEKAAPKR